MSETQTVLSLLATYRIQLHAGFSLQGARELVDYVHALGITHLYLSPIMKSRSGSAHGYDVVDPDKLDPELGTESDLQSLVDRLHACNMGVLLDVVPNHMAASDENPRWEHLLTFGHRSPFAKWFDIDWSAPDPDLHRKIMLPVLGQPRSRVLDDGELALRYDAGRVRLCYYEHHFPLNPRSASGVLSHRLHRLTEHPGCSEADGQCYEQILVKLSEAQSDPTGDAYETISNQLAALCLESESVRGHVRHTLEDYASGKEGRKRLEHLLDRQAYRVVYWRRAAREINYRRFFDINELVGLRMEDPQVFDVYHRHLLSWIAAGYVDAVRVDHIDGICDPQNYLERLSGAADACAPSGQVPIYVEKILLDSETLRKGWPVAGTTGYEFLNQLESLFIDPSGYATIEDGYRRLIGKQAYFEDIAHSAKRRILTSSLSSYVQALTHLAAPLMRVDDSDAHRRRARNRAAIVEFIAALKVYRTYVTDQQPTPAAADRAVIEMALAQARQRASTIIPSVDSLEQVLLATLAPGQDPWMSRQRMRFIQRLQQTSGPAAAKGIEDTALYAYVPLASRNEVGGEPGPTLITSPARLHDENQFRSEHWPMNLLCTSTHDTKRSADVRARLDVLSEIPEQWIRCVNRWRRQHAPHRHRVARRWAPDANTEYLLYQSLVGIWPAELTPTSGWDPWRDRLKRYILKAVREAKVRTSWIDPDEAFESALSQFTDALFQSSTSEKFLEEARQLVQQINRPGLWTALSRTLVHLTAPGVPDVYQGDELWNFSLVDPDNRRPVDFNLRKQYLRELECAWSGSASRRRTLLQEMIQSPESGLIKMHVMMRTLKTRNQCRNIFLMGTYEPMEVRGAASQHVFAFIRRSGRACALTIVPRLVLTLTGEPDTVPLGESVWRDTHLQLPDDLKDVEWRCVLSDHVTQSDSAGTLRIGSVLSSTPVALLVVLNPGYEGSSRNRIPLA